MRIVGNLMWASESERFALLQSACFGEEGMSR